MRKLLLVCGVLLVSTVGYAKSLPMPFSECIDNIYANAGVRSREEAKVVCRMQNDVRFVECAVDKYNDLDYSYSSEQAIGSCMERFPTQSIHTSCVTILGSAGFDRMAAIAICDETTAENLSLAIPKCIYRLSRSHSDRIVDECTMMYENGDLNGEGYDKESYARMQKELERRRAEEEAARKAAIARAEAERQRQFEIARQKQAQRAAEAARVAEARRQAEIKRQQEIQYRKDRLALQRAEREERQRRLELEKQESIKRWEDLRRAEERQQKRFEPRVETRVEPKRVEPKKNSGVSQAEKARRAEELRRQEEQRNWEEMVRQEREREKKAGKKQNVVPKVDVPEKKKNQGVSEEERRRRDEEIQRKAQEGRERVERAKREAEERRKEQERERQEREKTGQEGQSGGRSNDGVTPEDVPPPPTGDFEDLPNPNF